MAGQTIATLLCGLSANLATLATNSIVVIEGGINDFNLSKTTFAGQLDSALDLICQWKMKVCLEPRSIHVSDYV